MFFVVAELFAMPSTVRLPSQNADVARGGFDFGGWRVQDRIKTIEARYELHDDEALAVLTTVRLYEQTAELLDAVARAQEEGDAQELGGIVSQLTVQEDSASPIGDLELDYDHRTVRASLEFLAEPAVAAAVLAETGVDQDRAGIALGLFAELVEPLAPRAARPARPALRWLRGKAYERLGDIDQAEQTYLAAQFGRQLKARYSFRGAVAELETTVPLTADEQVLLTGVARLATCRDPWSCA